METNKERKRILLVDDEQGVRDAIKMLLQIDEYEVVEAENGERALALFNQEPFSIVLTDFRMGQGRMTGGDLATAIKEKAPAMPLILITGFHDEVPPGVFDAVLYKPFSLDQLRKTITKWLR